MIEHEHFIDGKFVKLKVGDIIILPIDKWNKYKPSQKEIKWTNKNFTKAYAWKLLNHTGLIIGYPLRITSIEIEPENDDDDMEYGFIYTDFIIINKISKEIEPFEIETSETKFINDLLIITEEEARDIKINNILV